MSGSPKSHTAKLLQRISFLEGQLRIASRLATEASEAMRENAELRRRQHWLEKRVNDLELELRNIEEVVQAAT
jgi:hypothetical protein